LKLLDVLLDDDRKPEEKKKVLEDVNGIIKVPTYVGENSPPYYARNEIIVILKA